MIREHAHVALRVDLPDHGLAAGDVGVVVLIHPEEGYEVEFMTLRGDTLAVVSVSRDQVRPIAADEIAHARKVARV